MLECEISHDNGIATVALKKPRFGFSLGLSLEDGLCALDKPHVNGVIFDASNLKKMSHGMLGCLLDVVLRFERSRAFRPQGLAVAVCGLPEKTQTQAQAQGLDRVVPLFASIADVMSDPQFQSVHLRGTRAVVLCANQGARLAPLTNDTPAAMLNFLGRPLLGRVLDQASKYGLNDFVVNPGYGANTVQNFAQSEAASIFCVNEANWQKQPCSDVATLLHLQDAHSLFSKDTLILQSNVLSDVDLAAMMRMHRSTRADATIAVAQTAQSVANDHVVPTKEAQSSAIILSPDAIMALARNHFKTRSTKILPALRAAGLDIQLFAATHKTAAINCGADYYSCQSDVLTNGSFGIEPVGEQVAPKVWVADTGHLHPKAEIEGPCFVDAHAKVSRGAHLKGANIVGSGAQVGRNVVLSNSILLPETAVAPNSFVDHMITGPHWSVNHRFADGSLQNRTVLDGIGSISDTALTPSDALTDVVKIA